MWPKGGVPAQISRDVGLGKLLFFKNQPLPLMLSVAQPNEGLRDSRTSSPITGMQGGHLGGCRASGNWALRGACQTERSSKGQGSLIPAEPTGTSLLLGPVLAIWGIVPECLLYAMHCAGHSDTTKNKRAKFPALIKPAVQRGKF